jgi:phage baseplate assembly protein V
VIKYGNITQIDAAKGTARVHFDDIDIVSGWLPIIYKRTFADKESDPLEEKEHVACLMDERLENGVILGAIYSTEDTPPETADAEKYVREFSDGTIFTYDKTAHEYKIENGELEFTMNRTSGFDIKKGGESLKAIIDDILTQSQALTVTCSAPTVASSPPINAAAFAAISVRVNTFFS